MEEFDDAVRRILDDCSSQIAKLFRAGKPRSECDKWLAVVDALEAVYPGIVQPYFRVGESSPRKGEGT